MSLLAYSIETNMSVSDPKAKIYCRNGIDRFFASSKK